MPRTPARDAELMQRARDELAVAREAALSSVSKADVPGVQAAAAVAVARGPQDEDGLIVVSSQPVSEVIASGIVIPGTLGAPVFAPIAESAGGFFCESHHYQVTFYESAVTIDHSTKSCCFPESTSRQVVPRKTITDVAFSHDVNKGCLITAFRIWLPFVMHDFAYYTFLLTMIIAIVCLVVGSKAGDVFGVIFLIFGFICIVPIFIGAFILINCCLCHSCMVHNVTLYKADNDVGDSWVGGLFKFFSRTVPLPLSMKPPQSKIMAWVFNDPSIDVPFTYPVFPKIEETVTKFCRVSKTGATFFQNAVVIDRSMKWCYFPKTTSTDIIPRKSISNVSFSKDTNKGLICTLFRLGLPLVLANACFLTFIVCIVISIVSFSSKTDKGAGTAFGVIFLLVALCLVGPAFISAYFGITVGSLYCMQHNVTLLKSSDDMGDSCVGGLWRLLNRRVSIALDKDPPQDQIMAWVHPQERLTTTSRLVE